MALHRRRPGETVAQEQARLKAGKRHASTHKGKKGKK